MTRITSDLLTATTHPCNKLTCTGQSQLPADDFSIPEVPKVIAHCAPGVVEAHLHSSLQLCATSHQPHISIVADYMKETQINALSFPQVTSVSNEGLTESSAVHLIRATNTVLIAITHKRFWNATRSKCTNPSMGADNISATANSICM